MRVPDFLLLGFGVLVIVALAGAPQAHAETAPTYAAPLPDIVTAVEQKGGALLDLVDMPGANFDQVVFFDMQGTIVFGLVVDGCVISSPVALGKMRKATPA